MGVNLITSIYAMLVDAIHFYYLGFNAKAL